MHLLKKAAGNSFSLFEVMIVKGRCFAWIRFEISGMKNSIRSNSKSRSLGNSISALSISSMRTIVFLSRLNASPSAPSRM
ncbi:hypothetical protein B2G51_07840 [Leptospira santarosai]|nr:hypothetical protein B2G51_07840 [Leptospira santarosai]